LGLFITANIAGNAMIWHFRLGYFVVTLVLFRLVWGFAGGYWSRFSSFLPSPSTLFQYLKNKGASTPSTGHNPLGALSVVALLFFLLVQVTTGLMSDDEIAATGPLVNKIPLEWVTLATFIHTEVTKFVLIFLVVLHIAAILWHHFKKGENLVAPMISGDKQFAVSGVTPSRDNWTSRTFAIAVLLLCGTAVNLLLRWAS
jgi:cytochrome b